MICSITSQQDNAIVKGNMQKKGDDFMEPARKT